MCIRSGLNSSTNIPIRFRIHSRDYNGIKVRSIIPMLLMLFHQDLMLLDSNQWSLPKNARVILNTKFIWRWFTVQWAVMSVFGYTTVHVLRYMILRVDFVMKMNVLFNDNGPSYHTITILMLVIDAMISWIHTHYSTFILICTHSGRQNNIALKIPAMNLARFSGVYKLFVFVLLIRLTNDTQQYYN